MADIGIGVRGVPEVQRALSQLSGSPEAKRALQKASTAGAKTLKPFVQAEAPRITGRLRKSVSSRQARKERPAAIVSARPKVAFYRHMVIRGTKPHMIRFPNQRAAGVPRSEGNIRHPGIRRGNDFVARGFEAGRDAAESKIEQTMAAHVEAVARANGGG